MTAAIAATRNRLSAIPNMALPQCSSPATLCRIDYSAMKQHRLHRVGNRDVA